MPQDQPSGFGDRDTRRIRTGAKKWDSWALGIAGLIIAVLFSLWLNSISTAINDLKTTVNSMDDRLRAVEISVSHIKGHLGMTAGDGVPIQQLPGNGIRHPSPPRHEPIRQMNPLADSVDVASK